MLRQTSEIPPELHQSNSQHNVSVIYKVAVSSKNKFIKKYNIDMVSTLQKSKISLKFIVSVFC